MPANGSGLLSLTACVGNGFVHVLLITGLFEISIGYTWPIHLLSMVMFLAMLFSLFSSTYILGQDLTHKARVHRGELHEYMEKVQGEQLNQSIWQNMFGKTPVWVGIVCVLMFLYSFGMFAIQGFQTPYSIRDRDGELWFYDESDGWVRRATPEDVERDKFHEIRFATSAFTLFAFLPWAYFRYRKEESGRA